VKEILLKRKEEVETREKIKMKRGEEAIYVCVCGVGARFLFRGSSTV
jgi:hypothetical protein